MVPVTFLRFILPSAGSLWVVLPTTCQLLEGRRRRRRKGLGFAPGLLWLRHLSGRRRFPAGVVTPVGSCSVSEAADPSAPDAAAGPAPFHTSLLPRLLSSILCSPGCPCPSHLCSSACLVLVPIVTATFVRLSSAFILFFFLSLSLSNGLSSDKSREWSRK